MARLNIFDINPELGVRPTIEVLDGPPGSEYKDILVRVKEAKTGSLLLGGGIATGVGLWNHYHLDSEYLLVMPAGIGGGSWSTLIAPELRPDIRRPLGGNSILVFALPGDARATARGR